MRLSEKLGALCAAATLLPLAVVSSVALYNISSISRADALAQLQSNGRAASRLYEKRLAEMQSAAQQLAGEIANKALVASNSAGSESGAAWARLQDLLPQPQNEFGLDFLIVTDQTGRVIARHNDRPAPGETVMGPDYKNLIAEKAISNGAQLRNAPVASCAIEQGSHLARMGLDRVAQVARADDTVVAEALMIEAAAPIFSGGRFVGIVLIGQMLNNFSAARAGATSLQTPLVTETKQILYPAETEAGALIALGDTVVASSVFAKSARRDSATEGALKGMKRDPAKTEQADTLREGERDYAVLWQPLKSLDGTAIGAIGVAAPAGEMEGGAGFRATLIVICALAFLLAATVGFLYGRFLGARLESLTEAASRMSVGELGAVVKDRDSPPSGWIPGFVARDEISRLAGQLDQMRESFRQAIERLRKR